MRNSFNLGRKKKVKSLSRVRLFETPWTIAHQAPRSMGFSRQEYWSGLLFPSPGDLPNPGIEPCPALAGGFFTTSTTWEASWRGKCIQSRASRIAGTTSKSNL